MIDKDDIHEMISEGKHNLKDTCNDLISRSKNNGGYDNISVILIFND